ncbi:MAG: ribonuclease R [Verrucomicrobiae bacterium]|nr:ribonuclease R [Verrucomicrobiae bacterium]
MNQELKQLKDEIQTLLLSPGFRPLRVGELVDTLRIPPAQRHHVRRILDQLVREGVIVRLRKDRLVLPSLAGLLSGRICLHEKGFGFVTLDSQTGDSPGTNDVFIPAEDTGVALHGDKVLVRLHDTPSTRHMDPARRRCGRVIRVLERKQPTLVGVLQKTSQFHFVVPDDPRFGRDVYVNLASSRLKARIGDRVVVKLNEWTNRHVNPEGTLIEVIGRQDDPRHDTLSIVRRYNLPADFPGDVLAEAAQAEEKIPPEEWDRRLDLTREIVVTIDPDDARDHDDALSLHFRSNGHPLLGVHIADVAHYVRPHSKLDREAFRRGNSVYFPDRVLPMLPPRISTQLCSLMEGQDRLCRSVFFALSPNGTLESHWFADTIIRSAARLTYRQALDIIQPAPRAPLSSKPAPPPPGANPPIDNPLIQKLLRDLWRIASCLRKQRFEQGSLDLDFPELKVHCDSAGQAVRVEKKENDISHQLVEECMLLANEYVAACATQRGIPSLYRIHEDPEPEKLEAFRDMVLANGLTMGDPSIRHEIQKLLRKLDASPEHYILKLHLLRSLKRAGYATTPVGHYGLAKANYTHFTSPIRRYADLVVHRSLPRPKACRLPPWDSTTHPFASPTHPPVACDLSTLGKIADHCSTTERVADEASKEAAKLKLLQFFERQIAEKNLESFDAIVVEVRNFGFFVELPDFLMSGLVHVSSLNDDFYRFDPARQQLTGKKSRRSIRAGARLRVEVARVDRLKKQIDFRLCN